MKHHKTPSSALFATLLLVFATTSTLAFAAPGAEPVAKPAAELSVGATASTNARTTEGDDGHDAARRNRRDHGLTSILVPIAFFLCILLLVGTIQYMGLRKDRNKHLTLQLMVEKGAQIPAELITSQKRRGSDLRRGLVLVGAGLGISLFLLMTKDARNSGAFGMGLIPALIGGGYLLAWKLEGRKQPEQPLPTATYSHDEKFASTQRDEPNPGDEPNVGDTPE
jgi:Domain of unknown function (DUF6249)